MRRMSTIQKSHKIALRPTVAQERFLRQQAGFARRAYNDAVARFKAGIDADPPQWLGLRELSSAHTQDKLHPDNAWMRECIAVAGFQAVRHAAEAVRRWGAYRKSLKAGAPARYVGAPRFHSRAGRWSFTVTGGALYNSQIRDKAIRIPKVGWIKMREPLRFEGRVHTMTISRHGERWYASCAVDTGEPVPEPGSRRGPTIAAHPGVRVLLTEQSADETERAIYTEPPRSLDRSLRRLRTLDKAIARSRTTHGSEPSGRRRRLEARRRRLHARASDIRHDVQHRISRTLIDRAGVVRLEQWDTAGMLRMRDDGLPRRVSRRLHRDLADAAPASLVHKIDYKAQWAGVLMERYPRGYPSSTKCSECGFINEPTPNMLFSCHRCGFDMNREANATWNMQQDSPCQEKT